MKEKKHWRVSMEVSARTVIFLTSLLSCLAMCGVQCAMLWFEEPPSLDDPCTTIVVSTDDDWLDIHPPENCLHGGIVWYATFGSVRIWFKMKGTDEEEEERKRPSFELCLTAGSKDRVAIFWEYNKSAWSPIVYPTRSWEIPSRDRCRKSSNGTMTLFLKPIKERFMYVTHLTYDITLLEENDEEEERESIWSSLF